MVFWHAGMDVRPQLTLEEYSEALGFRVISASFDNMDYIWDRMSCLPIQYNSQLSDCYVDGLLLEDLEATMQRAGILMCRLANEWKNSAVLEQYSERKVVKIV
jgi:hypothetical protein